MGILNQDYVRNCILVLFLPLYLNLCPDMQTKLPFIIVLLTKTDETNDASGILSIKNLAKYSQNYTCQAQIQTFQPTSCSNTHDQNSCFITQIIKDQIKLQFLVNKSIFGTTRLFLSLSTVGHDKIQFYLPLQ